MGKSGCGKSFLIKEIVGNNDDNYEVKSYTTRSVREDDPNDINTHTFVSRDFWNEKKDNALATYHNVKLDYWNWTDESSFQKDKINLYAIDPMAFIELQKDKRFDISGIYIDVSEKERAKRWLKREKSMVGFTDEPHLDLVLLDGVSNVEVV